MSTGRVLSLDAAVRGGIEQFLRRATLDMDALARELAVSRATLYRTVGSRDALLGEVLWAMGRYVVEQIWSHPPGPGADGVIEVSRRFADALAGADPLWRFAREEPEAAHRVLLSPTCAVHARSVLVQRELFVRLGEGADDRAAQRRSTMPVVPSPRRPRDVTRDDLTERAFVYVRILESVLYGPMLAGRRADFTLAEPALRAILA